MKPNRCTNFTNLFWHETLHVSDSSSVHHQEFILCTLKNGICHTGLRTYTTAECTEPQGTVFLGFRAFPLHLTLRSYVGVCNEQQNIRTITVCIPKLTTTVA